MTYSLEQDLFARKAQALELYRQGIATDPLTVSRLLNITRTWPTLGPGSALSFAQSGLDHTSPVVAQAAKYATAQKLNQSAWGTALPNTDHQRQSLPDDAQTVKLASGRNIALTALKALDPTTDPSILRKYRVTLDQWNEAVQQHLVTPREDTGGILGNVGEVSLSDVVHGAVREGATALAAPLQFTQGLVRNKAQAISNIAGGDFSLTNIARAADPTLASNEISAINQVATGNNTSPYLQTDVGQQIKALANNQSASLGNGWLPDPNSPVAKAQAEASRQAAPTIGGHAFTLGRAGASLIFEPNTVPFNALSGAVDATVAMKADPSALALKSLSDARAASKVFQPEDAKALNGLVDDTGQIVGSTNPDLVQNTKTAWLNGEKFTSKLPALQKMNSESEVIRFMRGDQIANRINPDLAVNVIAANGDASLIRKAFNDATLTDVPTLGGFGYKIKSTLDTKLLARMPNTHLDSNDVAGTWDQLDKWMLSASVPRDTRNAVLDPYLRDPNAFTALSAARDAVAHTLETHLGIDDKKLAEAADMRVQALALPPNDANRADMLARGRDLTNEARPHRDIAMQAADMFKNHDQLARAYDIDQATGLERVRPGVVVSDTGYVFPTPTLDSERFNSTITLPDPRELRRLSSKFSPIFENPVVKNTTGFADGIINTWKTAVVARPALLAKVTLEQQLNLAARGMPNVFTHPFAFLSALVGTNMDDRWGQFLNRVPGIEPSMIFGPDQAPVLQDADNLLQHTLRYTGQDPSTFVTHQFIPVPPTDKNAGQALADNLGRMYSDPIMRGVANADSPEAAKEWFWSGAGKGLRINKAKITAADDAYNAQKAAADPRLTNIVVGDLVNDRAAADRYLEQSYMAKLNDYTNGSDELLNAVKTGKLGGRDIYSWPSHLTDAVDQRTADYAKSLLDQGYGPQTLIPLRSELTHDFNVKSTYRRFMDMAFHYMIDAPDRTFNRSPAFAYFKWNNTADLAPYINHDELPTLIEQARAQNLPADLMKRIEATKLDTTDTPRLSIDQITDAATRKALGYDLPKTVHDLTSRTHIMDAMRILVPFGDAWRLVMQRAVNLVKDQPQVLERARQVLTEAHQPGSSTINQIAGDPVDPNQGFFHTDPLTGEQVFTIPGSTLLTKETLGVPIPLYGQVKGLSMLGDTYPGLGGPALSLPAKWLLPDTPTGTAIKDVLFKYGDSQSEGFLTDIAQGFVPSWVTKLVQGAPNQRTFNSTVNAVMQTLASSGDYNLHNPDDLSRLAHDAKTDARWLYVIRGAGQFLTPAAPSQDTRVYDKHGVLREAEVLANKYYTKSKTLGPDRALQWVIDTFGTKNVFLTQAASQPTAYAAPTSRAAQQWVDAHPGVASKYPLVYGLFAPAGNPNDFDPNVYAEQFAKGERVSLTADQQIAQAENRLGFYVYNQAQAKIKGRTDKAATDWLAQVRAQIKTEFPGFDTYLAAPYDSTKRRNDAIVQLQAAAEDPAIQSTDAGQGLSLYLQARTQAITAATKAGLTAGPWQAKRALPARTWLRDVAHAIIAEHPGFETMWTDIFAREMKNDG